MQIRVHRDIGDSHRLKRIDEIVNLIFFQRFISSSEVRALLCVCG